MTDSDRNDERLPEHGDFAAFEGDGARRDRVQRLLDEGREAELEGEDYDFAIRHGLIEG